MGLIKNNLNYIRLTTDGTYYIYKTKENRELEKKVTSPEEVIKKYHEIIHELEQDKEAVYYLGNAQLLKDWRTEFFAYLDYNTANKFPLMKAYIEDIDESIPQFVGSGRISVKGDTLEEIYEYVKKYKIFGETEDDL
jgi:hypothetical protein